VCVCVCVCENVCMQAHLLTETGILTGRLLAVTILLLLKIDSSFLPAEWAGCSFE
jgi:hypothetical protein